jgi:hypothetical protein
VTDQVQFHPSARAAQAVVAHEEIPMNKIVTVLAVAAVLSAAESVGPVAASAATPTVMEKQAHFTRAFGGIPLCPDFTVSATFDVTRTDTVYYDNDGALVREVLNVKFDGVWSNDSTGTALHNKGTRHITDNYVTETSTEDGVLRHITVAGTGIVLHQSGRIVYTWNGTPPPAFDDDAVIFEAGPHEDGNGDLAGFCAALA